MRRLIVMLKRLGQLFNLDTEVENFDNIHQEILKGVSFRGTNLWILFFAIIVASVGLNMNSTAVIIGAMLISPLMGPINGMGYSIATYDMELFKKSIKNFSYAVGISLLASTAYFAISPISTAHSELLARTSPSIYDVLIALFGGLAGIVAISSKQKGNVIPGVAIATALMPPLCTAGYGIATRQFDFFLVFFVFFTINTIFIAIASVWISKLLNFPIRTMVDGTKKKKINRTITLVITAVLLPSIFFGYKLVLQEDFVQRSNLYVSNVSLFEGQYLLRNKIDHKANTITLIYGGTMLSEKQKGAIIAKSKDFKLENATIVIEQGLTVGNMDDTNMELFRLKEQVFELRTLLDKKNVELDSILNMQKFGIEILNEIKIIYPQIIGCQYSESFNFDESVETPQMIPIVILSTKTIISNADKTKINNWLRQRLKNSSTKIFYE